MQLINMQAFRIWSRDDCAQRWSVSSLAPGLFLSSMEKLGVDLEQSELLSLQSTHTYFVPVCITWQHKTFIHLAAFGTIFVGKEEDTLTYCPDFI